MNMHIYRSQLSNAFAHNTFLKITVVGLVLATLLLSMGLIAALNASRTILLPPEINKTFWIERDAVSREYLEGMALYITQLELNITPASHGYQTKVLLNYIHPNYHGKMQAKFLADGEQLRKDNASTWFSPRTIQTDAKEKRVAITGEFVVTIGEKQVVKQNKTYVSEFEMSGGRMFLTKFEEVHGDAFAVANDQDGVVKKPDNNTPKD